jgi:hypothetical protein
MLAKEVSARPASVGEALELLVAAGHVAGALVGAAPLPPPSNPTAFHAMATVPSINGHTPDTIITSNDPASPNGNTFLASEADIAPSRRSRARFGAIAAVVVLGLLVGGAVMVTLGGGRSTKGAGLTAGAGPGPGTVGASVTASASSSPTAAAASVAVATAHSEDVEIRIEGAPKDARVLLGARELGVVPGPFTLKAGAPVTLTIVAKGWKSRELPVTPTSSTTLQVALEKSGPAVQAGKPGAKGQPISSELENFDKK